MDTAAAERALRENALTVKGKGGKIRIVPIEDDRITMMLERLLEKTERGHKLLVPDGVPTDRAINGMQQFILRHRDAIRTSILSLPMRTDVPTRKGRSPFCSAS